MWHYILFPQPHPNPNFQKKFQLKSNQPNINLSTLGNSFILLILLQYLFFFSRGIKWSILPFRVTGVHIMTSGWSLCRDLSWGYNILLKLLLNVKLPWWGNTVLTSHLIMFDVTHNCHIPLKWPSFQISMISALWMMSTQSSRFPYHFEGCSSLKTLHISVGRCLSCECK